MLSRVSSHNLQVIIVFFNLSYYQSRLIFHIIDRFALSSILNYGRFAGRIFMISIPGSSAALSLYRDLGQ